MKNNKFTPTVKSIVLAQYLIISNFLIAQNREDAIAIAGSGIASIFATVASYEAFVDKIEHKAVEWVLVNRPELSQFKLKLLNLRGEKLSHLSDVECIVFSLDVPGSGPEILLWFVSYGWYNDYGVNFDRIVVKQFNGNSWRKIVWSYLCAAECNPNLQENRIPYYELVSGGISNANRIWKANLDESPNLSTCTEPNIIPVDSNQFQFKVLKGIVSFDNLIRVTGKSYEFKLPSDDETGSVLTFNFPSQGNDSYCVMSAESVLVIFNERNVGLFLSETGQMVHLTHQIFEKISDRLLY
ncbi:MAG: hypothetical protein JNM00_02325 [Flavobacteriales bacterium]|nr:hypothetical protein [Flavobacteriales bacterium]